MGFFDFFKTENEEVLEKTYKIKTICLNCKTCQDIEIKKDVCVKKGLRNFCCSNCGLIQLAPYFFTREIGRYEESYEAFDPFTHISGNQIPDEILKEYYKKDGKKKTKKTP